MSRERELIENAASPATRQSLAQELLRIGLHGQTVLVHTRLSSLGWVCGGAVALIQALMDAAGPQGTLMMPAHSGDLSDPAKWCNPPVPPAWQQTIRDTMPAYDPRITPTRGIGVVPELFRTFPGVRRSAHPAVSFCAWGAHSDQLTDGHALDLSLGEGSPLARLYELDGWVLLLGSDYGHCTSLHLAEYRADVRPAVREGSPVTQDGRRVWRWYDDIDFDDDPFQAIGEAYEATGSVALATVAQAQCRLLRMRPLVDFAVRWLREHAHEG
jgi:aminoglycoside 3-N-acetyltransferase